MALTVGILCAGASVELFLRHPVRHDILIGVNRMAAVYPCDWWVFGDWQALGDFEIPFDDLPKICTSVGTLEHIKANGLAERRAAFEVLTVQDIPTTCRNDFAWSNWSMTIAMVLAEHLVTEFGGPPAALSIYGCDWSGELDFDGTPPRRGGRNEYRWNNEQHRYSHIAAWLTDRGVSVTRVGHDNGKGETVKSKDKDKAKSVPVLKPEVITLVARKPMPCGSHVLAVGDPVAEVHLQPDTPLGFVYRAGADGLIGPPVEA